jgi:predicted outer membrane repeat protein
MKGAAVGAAGDSPDPGQAPCLLAGTKRAAAPPRRPNDPTGAFGNLGLSTPPFSFFVARLHYEYISFSHNSSSSGAAIATGTAAPAAGTTATEAAVGAIPGPATGGEPQTPEGVPEDVLEELEEP